MKYIKNFESKKDRIIDLIKNKAIEWSYDEYFDDDMIDCPFISELAIIHQKNYISEMYDLYEFSNNFVDLSEFIKIYTDLLEASRDIIISSLKRNPSLYSEWKYRLDNYDDYLNIPEYIKNAGKYNL